MFCPTTFSQSGAYVVSQYSMINQASIVPRRTAVGGKLYKHTVNHYVEESWTQTVNYSQLSLRRTPSGPAAAVYLREVSGL